MDQRTDHLRNLTRRHFFGECGLGVGKIALASLLAGTVGRSAFAADPRVALNPLAPKPSQFTPKAKRIIYMFMAGAPSHLDLFDYKPKLAELAGKPLPPSVIKDQRYAFIQRNAQVLGPQFTFARHGQSGAELSEMLPHLSEVADDVAIVRSMHTEQFNHAPAQIFLLTGAPQPGRPSMGAWLSYGLGSEADDLPAFVVLSSGGGTSGGAANWGSGFLPATYAGVPFRASGDPILNVANPPGVDQHLQRDTLDAIGALNHRRLDAVGDPDIAARIAAFEMAYRMQTRAPELMDLSGESKETLEMYGVEPGKASFGNNCLLARRLVERGVRCVTLFHKGWDHHSNVRGGLQSQCGQTDQPAAVLIKDLKQRGMLEDTLIVWGGEFGRTPMVEANAALGRSAGRDHHPQAFTVWLAGAGVKAGQTLGATDELGFHVEKDPVHIHDLQATILYLMGIDHERLTFRYQGRDFRLTDVHGHVVEKLLA